MFSFDAYSKNNIGLVSLAILFFVSFGCNHQATLAIDISPKHFKVQTPFMLSGRGIIVNTYWGSEKQHHVLCFDNYSPSWIKRSLVQYNQSFTKLNGFGFKTSTADGSPIQGDVGICDHLSFENIVFKKVPFYMMPSNLNDKKNDDGVFGLDMIEKGVWKIDFKNSELTFASSIDSFSEVSGAEIFPATFSNESITVPVDFGKNNVKTMAVDLGYNGEMLIPLSEFKNINISNKRFTNPGTFYTPASEDMVTNLFLFDTVSINRSWFFMMVSTNEKAKYRLIGLNFFKRFDYVIFDFIDSRIYIPKKVW